MSAELYSVSGSGGNNGSLQGTTLGGSKPLHRFLKGQPKITGTIVLILGAGFLIFTVAVMIEFYALRIWTAIPPTLLLGALFIASGILYILTAHNPTKKTVTASLALSILSVLGTGWTILHFLPHLIHYIYYSFQHFDDNATETETWSSYNEAIGMTLEAIVVFYSFVGGIIFIVMSALAGAALRSTKSQAIVVMTTTPTETPAE